MKRTVLSRISVFVLICMVTMFNSGFISMAESDADIHQEDADANDVTGNISDDYIVGSKEYVREDGVYVIETVYFIPDATPYENHANLTGVRAAKSVSGSGTCRASKEEIYDRGSNAEKRLFYYAQGYFKWDGRTVSVSSPVGAASGAAGVTKTNHSTTSGKTFTGKAYVRFSFTATTRFGMSKNLSVQITVGKDGRNS